MELALGGELLGGRRDAGGFQGFQGFRLSLLASIEKMLIRTLRSFQASAYLPDAHIRTQFDFRNPSLHVDIIALASVDLERKDGVAVVTGAAGYRRIVGKPRDHNANDQRHGLKERRPQPMWQPWRLK